MMKKKRILILGLFRRGALGASLAAGFERLGCEVFRFDYDLACFRASCFSRNRYLRRLFRSTLWERMNLSSREVARCVQPELILAVKAPYLDAETVRELRQLLGVPFVNYYPDNPYCGVAFNPTKTSAQRRNLLEVLKQYSRVWIWSPQMATRLQHDGVCAGYLPFAADMEAYRPFRGKIDGCAECCGDHRIVFVGQHNRKREIHLRAIQTHSVAVWGARWRRVSCPLDAHSIHRGEAFGETAARLYSAARVSLNVVDDLNIPGHNMRTFEVPASGGVLLSSYTEEQAAFFPENEAACYFRSTEELDSKVDRLMRDDEFASKIRRNATQIAATQTYCERAASIMHECGVSL